MNSLSIILICLFPSLLIASQLRGAEIYAVDDPNCKELPPDAYRSSDEIILAHGYGCETHYTTTPDGFKLKLFRILTNSTVTQKQKKRPLILQHGLLDDSDAFLVMEENSAGFFFANAGFDVWLTNVRGTRYSNENVNYTDEDDRYWNFTFEQMGTLDATTYIKYICNATGFKKVSYIGHSQGTSMMFALMALMPNFTAEHLHAFAAWAPITNLYYSTKPGVKGLAKSHIPSFALKVLGWKGFMKYNSKESKFLAKACSLFPLLCDIQHWVIEDKTTKYTDDLGAVIYEAHTPAGSSMKEMVHYMQLLRNEGFNRYRDHRRDPLIPYPLHQIYGLNIGLFAGIEDALGSVENTVWLVNQLVPTNTVKFFQEYEHMAHFTFLAPKESVREFMYDTLTFLNNHYPEENES